MSELSNIDGFAVCAVCIGFQEVSQSPVRDGTNVQMCQPLSVSALLHSSQGVRMSAGRVALPAAPLSSAPLEM